MHTIETRLEMSTVMLLDFLLLSHTWLSIYKRLIALALAGGSGTEPAASDRCTWGHSEMLKSWLKTVEQVTASTSDGLLTHKQMENTAHESLSRGLKSPLPA